MHRSVRLTGKATEMDVASRAAISVMIHRLRNAAMNRHPGWNFSGIEEDDRSEVASLSCCSESKSGFDSAPRG
jgi:hypothetical protein